ncbi:MAG: prolyl oligopeptidase family serine peptidase, partial [Flavobacteriales bacterium]|nr:prolyl oligopeptidase family serine peptidase [Flavobacteriales bacterium]
FGKSFLNAGDLEWGKLMQDDITWGVKHLIKKGIADEKRIAIMGGSYGGYATLAGLAFTPELYACGVDIVGPSNIFTLLESVPAYWEAGRAFLYGMVGDPETEEGRKRIEEASPLFSADKIEKPLLIIQGANDPRVKKAEADQIAIALRDRGHEVSYLLADDEGHGFSKPVNRMAMYAEVERFLAEHIGGRYQEGMPDDVAARLKELQVDIATVEYKPADEVATAEALPAITDRFAEGSYKYDVKIAVQGQEIPMSTTRTVAKDGDHWVVTDESQSPQGKMVDAVTYGTDLKPVSRKVQQGGQDIEMVYNADKVDIAMGENKMEISFEGALFTTGAGMETVLSGMPLEVGYEIVVMVPDLASMSAKQSKIHVAETETVDGVDYLRVNITGVENENDRTTVWINAKDHSVLKMEQVVPAMQNAVITTTKAG